MKKIFVLLTTFIMTSPASAEIVGKWSTLDGCKWQSHEFGTDYPPNFESIAYLTNKGLEGWEWNCDFINATPGSNDSVVYTADCSVEGETYPELLLIKANESGGYQVSLKNGDQPYTIDFPVQCNKP